MWANAGSSGAERPTRRRAQAGRVWTSSAPTYTPNSTATVRTVSPFAACNFATGERRDCLQAMPIRREMALPQGASRVIKGVERTSGPLGRASRSHPRRRLAQFCAAPPLAPACNRASKQILRCAQNDKLGARFAFGFAGRRLRWTATTVAGLRGAKASARTAAPDFDAK